MSVSVREALHDDAEEIAALHVAVWRATYRDLAPQAAIDALDEAKRLPAWRSYIAAPPPSAVFAASDEGRIIGVVAAIGEGEGEAEVKHLYVRPERRGDRIGRVLLAFAARKLIADGVGTIRLAVVAGNAPARAFYKSLGGVEAGEFDDPGPLWRSHNVRVVWRDPAVLTRAA
ncbi:MAG: GNAT family N-acetyltransferase [Pseudomonadota bacterium]